MLEAFGEGSVVRTTGKYPDGELCDWCEVTVL